MCLKELALNYIDVSEGTSTELYLLMYLKELALIYIDVSGGTSSELC
jgi:hypothetical protein